ncbi:alpha/beta fold hydrolase [Variovorax sp. YR752]|uniref:thioesterase II family protein n=1 Tax=Variovorax sp. YR752 TaxID=1884383 RepID=UPI003137E45A
MSNAWVRRFSPRPQARARLFCFAHAGAGASVYRLWPSGLPADLEVCAVQLPGRETRLHEPALTDMNQIVEAALGALVSEFDRPFAFFGHSMGAVVAAELAHALAARGGPLPGHLVVSGRRAPQCPETDPPLHRLDDADFVAELNRRYGGIPEEVLQHEELLQLLLPALRADLQALETSARAQGRAALPMPLSAFGGSDDDRAQRDQLEGWGAETRGPFRVRVFPGDHFYLQPRRTELLADLSVTLAPLLPAPLPRIHA